MSHLRAYLIFFGTLGLFLGLSAWAGPFVDAEKAGDLWTRGFAFQEGVVSLPTTGEVGPVHRAAEAPRGSATRICLDAEAAPLADPAREYWVTASHVVAGVDSPLISGLEARIEFDDPWLDLALLSTQRTGAAACLSPCLAMMAELGAGVGFRADASFFHPRARVEIEAVTGGRVMRSSLETVASAPYLAGLPGREGLGRVLKILARGLRGQSGGAVVGLKAPSREWPWPPFPGEGVERALVGLILQIDAEGWEMNVLPAPLIARRVRAHFKGEAPATRDGIRAHPRGMEYLPGGGVHLRSWRVEANGTGGLGDGGRGSGARNEVASGILYAGKRWLHVVAESAGVRRDWVEFEPAPWELVRALQAQGSVLRGVFEEPSEEPSRDEILRTDEGVAIPKFLDIPSVWNGNTPDLYDISGNEAIQLGMGGTPSPCVMTVAFARREGRDLSHAVLVAKCEEATFGGGRRMMLHVSDPRGSVLNYTFVVEAVPLPCAGEGAARRCPVQVEAWSPKISGKFSLSRDSGKYLARAADVFEKALRQRGARVYARDGLRRFHSVDALGGAVLLERFGGYRIEIPRASRDGGPGWVVAGPGSLRGVGYEYELFR